MSYLCRHVLLKDASGETQGFVRFESAPDGCSVDARASGLPSGARLLLLRRGGGFREAGALRAGAFRAVLRGEDAAALCGAVLAEAGKALVYGGDGDVSPQARSAAAQAFAPRAVSSRTESCRAVAQEANARDVSAAQAPQNAPGARPASAPGGVAAFVPQSQGTPDAAESCRAVAQEAGAREASTAQAPQNAPGARPTSAPGGVAAFAPNSQSTPDAAESCRAVAQEANAREASIAQAPQNAAGAPSSSAALAPQNIPTAAGIPPEALLPAQEAESAPSGDGLTFRSAGDGLRFDAVRYEDGTAALVAHAVAADSPLPPAGMPGAARIAGFWVERESP